MPPLVLSRTRIPCNNHDPELPSEAPLHIDQAVALANFDSISNTVSSASLMIKFVETGLRVGLDRENKLSPIQQKCFFALALILFLGFWFMPLKLGAADAPNPLPLLTHIAQVRALSPIEAARKYPVRVEAIVTYSQSQTGSHFFQDHTAGVWADFGERQVEFKVGQRMELSGVSDPGEFAPIISVTQIRDLGPGQLPAALTVSFDDLLTGRFDSHYVEFTGVVHETREEPGTLSLLLAAGHQTLWARVSLSTDEPEPKLLNALIRVRAVGGSAFNDRRQLVHVHLLASSLSELTVVRQGIPDPFELPLQTVSSLLQFNPAQVPHTMARVRGTVTLSIPGELVVIQEETGGIFAETSERMPLQAGDQVELAGWPLAGDYTPRLHNSVVRRISSGIPVEPIEVGNAAFDYAPPRPEVWDGRLVRLKGTLLDYSARRKEAVLLVDANGTTIQAVLHDSSRSDFKLGNHPALSSLRPGSELELTGVCAQTVDRHHILEKFNIHLRFPEDVRVLATPSMWTVANLAQVIAVLLFAVVLGGTWVHALRSQVRKVTVELAQKHVLLEQSAQSFIAIFNASPIPQSISAVASGRFLEVNEALLNKAGLARDEVIGKTVGELRFYADPASRSKLLSASKKRVPFGTLSCSSAHPLEKFVTCSTRPP